MKLELKQDTFKSNFGLEGIDAKINPEQLKKMWEMFANPYKDNISSIVREITSNCFDSHKEAKVDDAVIITFDKDQGGNFIVFSDFGTGLSPERISKIYINYLSSTKESSNEFIGAFGIGSKSPLSYTDVFFIDTVYEGIKYSYLMRKGDEAPRIEKIMETPVTQRNGTDIKIYIKDQNKPSNDNLFLGDIGSFAVAIKKQLRFFDNVVVRVSDKLNHLNGFTNYIKNLNNFTIYQGEHFIYRKDSSSVEEISICLGKVDYPIDYRIVFPDLKDRINLPFSLRFDIGELMVTHSREDIKYNQDTIDKIRKKLKLAVDELLGKLAKNAEVNFPKMEYDDIMEFSKELILNNYIDSYFKLKLDEKQNDSINLVNFVNKFVTLDKETQKHISISNYQDLITGIKYRTNAYNKDSLTFDFGVLKSYLGDSFTIKFPVFTHFKNTTLINNSNNLTKLLTITRLQKTGSLRITNVKKIDSYLNNRYIGGFPDENSSFYILDDSTNKLSSYFLLYLEETYKIKGKNIVFIKPLKNLQVYKNILLEDNTIYKNKAEWRKWIQLLQKIFEEPYLKKAVSLKDIQSKATKEWYKEYLKKNKIEPVVKEKTEKQIILNKYTTLQYYDISTGYKPSLKDWYKSTKVYNTIDDLKLGESKNNIYTTFKDVELNDSFIKAMSLSILFHSNSNNPKKRVLDDKSIVYLSQTNFKMLEKENLAYTIQDFVKDNKENLVNIYLYTKYLKEDKIKNLKSFQKQFFLNNSVEAEGNSLILYYLMGNNFLDKYKETEHTLTSIIESYDSWNKEVFNKRVEEYKKVIEDLFNKCDIDFEKEAKDKANLLLKSLENYELALNKHYPYLQFIYANPFLLDHSPGQKNMEKIYFNKFRLIEELGIIKPDSYFDKIKKGTLDLQSFDKEVKKDDFILKFLENHNTIKIKQFVYSSNNVTYQQEYNKSLLNLTFYIKTFQNYCDSVKKYDIKEVKKEEIKTN